MKIQHRLFLFLFNRKSLKLQTSFIPPVTSKRHLSREKCGRVILQRRVRGATINRKDIIENPLPIRSASTVVHGKCHGRSNVVLLQTLTTCERVVNKVYPFTEELVSIVLWCTIILAQVQLEVNLQVDSGTIRRSIGITTSSELILLLNRSRTFT